jgi:hypothetical protein
VPTMAAGNVAGMICNGDSVTEIDMAVDFDWVGFSASVRTTLKEELPGAVGVPEMTPVVAARVNPEGSEPDVIFQV